MACVIAFPSVRPAPDPYAAAKAKIAEILAREPPAPAPSREEEICQTLLRIERRLSQMERLLTSPAQRDLP